MPEKALAKSPRPTVTPTDVQNAKLACELAETKNKIRIARAMGKAIDATAKRMERLAKRAGYGGGVRMDRGAYATAKRDRTRTGLRPAGGRAQSHPD